MTQGYSTYHVGLLHVPLRKAPFRYAGCSLSFSFTVGAFFLLLGCTDCWPSWARGLHQASLTSSHVPSPNQRGRVVFPRTCLFRDWQALNASSLNRRGTCCFPEDLSFPGLASPERLLSELEGDEGGAEQNSWERTDLRPDKTRTSPYG